MASALTWGMTDIVAVDSPYDPADQIAAIRAVIALCTGWEVKGNYDGTGAAGWCTTFGQTSGGSMPEMRGVVGLIGSGTTAPAYRTYWTTGTDLASPNTYIWGGVFTGAEDTYDTPSDWKAADPFPLARFTGFKNIMAMGISSVRKTRYWAFYCEEILILCACPAVDTDIQVGVFGAWMETPDGYGEAGGDVLLGIAGMGVIPLPAANASLWVPSVSAISPFMSYMAGNAYPNNALLRPEGYPVASTGGYRAHEILAYPRPYHGFGVGTNADLDPDFATCLMDDNKIWPYDVQFCDYSHPRKIRLGKLRNIHPWHRGTMRDALLDGSDTLGYLIGGNLSGVAANTILLLNTPPA